MSSVPISSLVLNGKAKCTIENYSTTEKREGLVHREIHYQIRLLAHDEEYVTERERVQEVEVGVRPVHDEDVPIAEVRHRGLRHVKDVRQDEVDCLPENRVCSLHCLGWSLLFFMIQ